MSKKKQKLELTWIGKDERPKLEPRILIEDPELSYHAKERRSDDDIFDNILIHGDNLLALKALEQEYAGKVKCIYIDPPFNTGAAFDNYEDGLEHSIWLDLMYQRVNKLHTLLDKVGCIYVHLDDNELDYMKVILDEVFGRNNFINRITVEARSPSAFSTVNPGVFKASEYILWYAKDKICWESRSMRIPSNRDTAYNKYITNIQSPENQWNVVPLKRAFLEHYNSDRLENISIFLRHAYRDLKGQSATECVNYLQKNFVYYVMLNVRNVAGQLRQKIQKLDENEFFDWGYSYLLEKISIHYSEKDIDKFVYENCNSVFRLTEISDSGAGQETVSLKNESKLHPNKVFIQKRKKYDDIFIINGQQISFYSKNVHEVDGKKTATKLLTNIWSDISWEGIANEGGVKFKKGKKPEKLVERCLALATNPGDLVLDSFGGSGATAAVAHKMKRRWITIELADQAFTHIRKRISSIVDFEDKTGISKSFPNYGGGGFRYYRLAPSLLEKDKYGNWVISKEYNAAMLAEALCKNMGFTYAPSQDENEYWRHGHSTETDFIFVTTASMTHAALKKLSEDIGPDRTLLVCCKAFNTNADSFNNLTIKKIPHAVLSRCEWGRDDYSLNVANLPMAKSDEEIEQEKIKEELPLFGNEEG